MTTSARFRRGRLLPSDIAARVTAWLATADKIVWTLFILALVPVVGWLALLALSYWSGF